MNLPRLKTTLLIAFALVSVSTSPAAVLLTESFSYQDGPLVQAAGSPWVTHSGVTGQVDVASAKVNLTAAETEDVAAPLSGQPYSGGTNVLYASFRLRVTSLPTGVGSYFAHFKDGSSGFRARIWAMTNSAGPGKYRLALSSTGASVNVTNATDLTVNQEYTVVTRLYLSNSVATLWIDPLTEESASVSTTETAASATVTSYSFRQNSGMGQMTIDNLYVATTFGEATPPTPPSIDTQPQGSSLAAGKNVSLFVVAQGTAPLSYQWQFNSNTISGATSSVLSLTNIAQANEGLYQVVIGNSGGAITSAPALLDVFSPGASVSVMTYNVKGNGATNWSTNSLQVQAIGRQVSYLQPDIITFNEIPNSYTYEMTNFVKQYLPGYSMATNSGTDGFIRSVIVSRFPITRSQKWLDGVSLSSFGYTGNFARDLFEAQISVPDWTEPFHVFTTHLKALPDADSAAKRAAEASCVSNFFVTGFLTTNGARPYVLTGDLNEDVNRPPETSQQPIQRLANSATGLQLTTPVNPFSADDRTISIRDTSLSARFDYILPCVSLFTNFVSSQVFRTDLLSPVPPNLELLDDKTASDHLPVLMVFTNPYASVVVPPSIVTQPTNQLVNVGSTATMTMVATGSDLAYQWRKAGVDLIGATGSSLSYTNVQSGHAGTYSVIVSNTAGVVVSSNAVLSVNSDLSSPILKITAPSANQRLFENVKATNYATLIYGTTSDANGVSVQVKLNENNWQDTVGTTNWSLLVTNLIPGTNTVTVKATDAVGNPPTLLTRKFVYVVTSPFTLNILGVGSVTPTNLHGQSLEVGRNYKLTAATGTNISWAFTNWTRVQGGSTNHYSPSNVLTFTMESNLVLNANFITNPFVRAAGVYNGLFAETNGVTHHSAGYFTLRVTPRLGYTGKLLVGGNSVTVSGKFDIAGNSSKVFSRARLGKPNLTLNLALDLTNWTEQITGTVMASNAWTAELWGDRWVWTTNNLPTTYTNNYTMAFEGFSDATAGPPGWSVGLIKVDKLGRITLASSALADGHPLRQSTTLSKYGDWPFYAQAYLWTNVVTYNSKLITNKEYQGTVIGWLRFDVNTNAATTNLAPQGTVNWMKLGWTNALYPAGFTNSVEIMGSLQKFTAGVRVLNLTTGELVLANGNLAESVTNVVSLGTNNVMKSVQPGVSNLTTTVAAKSGLLSGSFIHPVTGLKQPYKAAILQDYNIARGYFTNVTEGGRVTLRPLP